MQFTAAVRVFKMGATLIPDPMPTASLNEVVRMLSRQFPAFRHTKLYEEDGRANERGEIVYDLILPEPKVKG